MGTHECERLTAAAAPELLEIDEAAIGVDRTVDREFYLTGGGRYGWLFRRAGRPVAYAMVRPDGWVGPVASVRRRGMEMVTCFAIGDLVWRGIAEQVRAGVAGACEGAQRAFWDAGLVFQSTPGLLLASRPFGRLDRYLAASYGMF